MVPPWIDSALAERLYREARAHRWHLPQVAFTSALDISCRKAFPGGAPGPRELSRYLFSLHLDDLALACACAEGHAAAWDHFILEMRPGLYRAADSLDPSGGARDLADALYGDLYGVDDRGGLRQSLLRYFHGRSSLATWLRAVLGQRYIDRVRTARRHEALPDDLPDRPGSSPAADPECPGLVSLLRAALERALANLDARERLRLASYYRDDLTLAQTGRLLHEHEATASRQLSRTRRQLREAVERDLRQQGLQEARVQRSFECATEDVGPMDLTEMLTEGPRSSS